MAGSNFGQAAGGLAGLGMALYGAYNSGPKSSSNKRFIKRANSVGMMNYGASDMAGLMSQINNTPMLQTATRRDFYDPSSEELFGTFFGSGMAAYEASQALTGPLRDLNSKEGFGGINIGSNAPEAIPSNFPNTSNNVSLEGGNPVIPEAAAVAGVTEPSWAPIDTTIMACGGHKHGCGGHKFGGGGSALATGIDLSNAGLGILSAYLGQLHQRDIAEKEAVEANATNDYARQMIAHNQDIAVNDTKNNMFNQQALQMMAMGGDLQTHGGNFPLNGNLNIIGAGGRHEDNPFGGVYQGMAEDGKPNLVEEDEVVWNDYVFSNRLTIPNEYAKKRKLKEGITFAEAAKKLSREARERPNDPISENGLIDALGSLQESQEEVRAKNEAARVKREIAKMSPEEVMNMVASIGGQEYANGGFLDAHLFRYGSQKHRQLKKDKAKKAQIAQDAMDKGLYANIISKLSDPWIEYLASQLQGYNPDDYLYTDAAVKRRQFLLDNYEKMGRYNGLSEKFAAGKRMPLLQNRPDYTYTNSYNMSQEQWDKFFEGMDAYQKSLKEAKTAGKYYADPDFIYNGRKVGKGLAFNEDVEKDPQYIAFKQYVRDQIEKYEKGEDADPNVLKYVQALDRNINTSKGARQLLQYDDKGNAVTDENGRYKFNDTWKDDYDERNFDQIGGIYHYYNGVPDVTRKGERRIVRLDGQEIEITPEEMAKLKRFSHGDNYITKVDDGNNLTTYYYDYTSPEVEGEYEQEEEIPGRRKLPTWMRYAPLLSGLGALQGPAKDYSTGVPFSRAHYTPIGDYLPYNPVDTQRYINAENQQAAAQLNAIMNASTGNRNIAMAQAALANQQRQQSIGQRMQAAEQINFDRLAKVGEFNRGTNMFNAQAHNQAELANLQINPLELRQAQQNAMMHYQADKDRDAAVSESLNAFLDSFGDIGRENFAFNQANSNEALGYGVDGNPWFGGDSYYKTPTSSGETYVLGQDMLTDTRKKTKKAGKITRKIGG